MKLTYANMISPSRSFVSYVSASRGESTYAESNFLFFKGNFDNCLKIVVENAE